MPVRVRYLRPVGPPLEKTYTLAPRSRTNIWVDHELFGDASTPDLAASDVSAVIETIDGTSGIIVERAMYFTPGGLTFQAGHESAGVTEPATRWYLAEGATGPFFDLFLLIANPTTQEADVNVTYLLPDGTQLRQSHRVGALQRFTIWVDHAAPALANTAVSMLVESGNEVPWSWSAQCGGRATVAPGPKPTILLAPRPRDWRGPSPTARSVVRRPIEPPTTSSPIQGTRPPR